MSKKMISLVCILSVLLTVALSGCSGNTEVAPAENTYDKQYSFSTYEQSPDIRIDGVLNEEVWQGKQWFSNTFLSNATGNMPVLELTGFPTEYGVYIASVVYDQNLTSDGERHPGTNSNWELYISACNVGDDPFSAEHNGNWGIRRIYVDLYGASNTFHNNIDRAVVVEGELNTGMSTKATLELFVPWEVLGVDVSKGIPETFGVLPCYRAVLQMGGSTSWMAPIDGSINKTTAHYYFDANGYTAADKEGNIVGDGSYGYAKSKGWDLSQVDSGIVHYSRAGTGKIFFSEYFGNHFIVEATITPVAAVDSNSPKAGINFLKPDGNGYNIWADLELPENADEAQEGVKVTVVKYGGSFWYFVDGKLAGTYEDVNMDADCLPALQSSGMDVYFSDYSCEAIDEARLNEYLADKGVTP